MPCSSIFLNTHKTAECRLLAWLTTMVLQVLAFAESRRRELLALLEKRKARAQTHYRKWHAKRAKDGGGKASLLLPLLVAHRRRLRRRTTSHNRRHPRAHKKPKKEEGGGEESGALLSRAQRRKRELNGTLANLIPGRAKRLETHLWHSKRYPCMKEIWGHRLAFSATRRPSKAPPRAARKRCVIHDASYLQVVEIKGRNKEEIMRLVSLLLDPMDVKVLLEGGKEGGREEGERMGEVFLYSCRSFPRGALGPARFLWRPVGREEGKEGGGEEEEEGRRLWVWLHPSFAAQVLAELEEEVGREGGREGGGLGVEVTQVPDLLLFELRGRFSRALLEEILLPIAAAAAAGGGEEEEAKEEGGREGGKEWWARVPPRLHHGTVLSLSVADPRERGGGREGGRGEGQQEQEQQEQQEQQQQQQPPPKLHFPPSLLWDPSARAEVKKRARARPDHVVNAEKQEGREGGRTWQGLLRGTPEKEEKSTPAVAGSAAATATGAAGAAAAAAATTTSIPLLLIARGGIHSSGFFLDSNGLGGFDLLLPLGWGKVFWHAMMRRQPHRLSLPLSPLPLGVKEREGVEGEWMLPSFPRDFPETTEGRRWWREGGREGREVERRRPKGKRREEGGEVPGFLGGKEEEEEEGKERGEEGGMVVIRRAEYLEAAVVVPGARDAYKGRIFPRLNFYNKYRELRYPPLEEGREEGREGGLALLMPPPLLLPSYAMGVLRCPWGGKPVALAKVFLPSSEDYLIWKAEEKEGGGGRGGGGVDGTAKNKQRRFAPSSRPASLPPSSSSSSSFERHLLGWTTAGSFCLREGQGVALALLNIEGLRLLQLRAGGREGGREGEGGVSGAMAAVVLVRNPRSTVMFPVRIGLQVSCQ